MGALDGPHDSGAPPRTDQPGNIEVRGARVHNLRNVDVSVPLGQLVAVAGVSGSGKSSLALGVLYAEGSRRYLEALSSYTRRRLTQAARPLVDSVEHVPAALALRQRPPVPGVRSTFGTSTELLNSLRLMFSRLGSHQCPNGHRLEPTIDVALDRELTCPVCGAVFPPPSAESFAFNSEGACPRCGGTGVVREVNESALVPDESLTIDQGAVTPWSLFGLAGNSQAAGEMGVRTDVPFQELDAREREIVFHGPAEKRRILYPAKNGKLFELNMTYRNARDAVEEALRKAGTEKGLRRIDRFLSVQVCPDCLGTRLSAHARSTLLGGMNLAQATALSLDEVTVWARNIPTTMPPELTAMARSIVSQLLDTARQLAHLGLGYLTLDRASSTLSTGERQRVQLSRAVRSRTTGVLYVLDEPSIGMHPSNIDGLLLVVRALLADGNSVVLVDHDVQLLREADWLIEIGPGSGVQGGEIIVSAPLDAALQVSGSRIAGFITGAESIRVRTPPGPGALFANGAIRLATRPLHTVQALEVEIPRGRLTVVTGVSGSGKTTMVLESLVPALAAAVSGAPLPAHVAALSADGVDRVSVVDASPVGANVRSTVATYSGAFDDLRRAYAATPEARKRGLKPGDFSYNTGSLRCPTCDGTGQISLDVQFLPDVDIVCPDCNGSRYAPAADAIRRPPRTRSGTKQGMTTADAAAADAAGEAAADAAADGTGEGLTLPELLSLTVEDAAGATSDLKKVSSRLRMLAQLGLGYLTLGEATPALSGGEAQRLKLASDLDRDQSGTVFVLDEPSIGLHPLDVQVLLNVLQGLIDRGGTVIAIDHDLDLIMNADYLVDFGPGGGVDGGRIIAVGTPSDVAHNPDSITGRYLRPLTEPDLQ